MPFFDPIVRELRRRGYAVTCTARRAFQVCELAARKDLPIIPIGRHHGRSRLVKLCGLFWRALQLVPLARRLRPALAISHGSRAQFIAANGLGIPSVLLEDYEYSLYPPLMRPRWQIMPNVIPLARAVCPPTRVRTYPGLKEDVYVPTFRPDPASLEPLGWRSDALVATVRPPATEAHYHEARSEGLFEHAMRRLLGYPSSQVFLLPRNARQAQSLARRHPDWFHHARTIVPPVAVDGLNLLWHSDLAVSGGGTMVREAAALGVPAYSIFTGRLGAVDQHLQSEGRLILLASPEDVRDKVGLVRRKRPAVPDDAPRPALPAILGHLEDIIRLEAAARG